MFALCQEATSRGFRSLPKFLFGWRAVARAKKLPRLPLVGQTEEIMNPKRKRALAYAFLFQRPTDSSI
jgi:hypothetical protein